MPRSLYNRNIEPSQVINRPSNSLIKYMRPILISELMVIAFVTSSVALAKTLDLRKHSDADGRSREISLCARTSPEKPLPGHAFIAFSEVTKEGKRRFRAIGHSVFTVGDALLSYSDLFTVEGALVDEKYTSIKQECLTLQVNKADYEISYELVAQPLRALGIIFDETKPIQKRYSLAAEDCVGFMINQAKFFVPMVVIPSRLSNELPLNYVRRLIDSN